MQSLSSSQTYPEVPVNENFETLEALSLFGKRQPVTTGLTWGFYGGLWGGTTVADGTVTLTNSATNYVVALRTTGVVSVSQTTTNWNSIAYARLYKLTTSGGVVTVEEDHRAGPRGVWGVSAMCIAIAASDETTAITVGTGKVTFRMPFAMTVVDVRASLTTAQTSGSIFTVDINESGTTILSTKLTIDNGEKTSTTAATAAVISDTALADDAEITIDVDQVGDGTAAGLKVYITGFQN